MVLAQIWHRESQADLSLLLPTAVLLVPHTHLLLDSQDRELGEKGREWIWKANGEYPVQLKHL